MSIKVQDAVPEPSVYRLLDARYGPMLVNPNDKFIGRSFELYGEFSEGEVALFRRLVKPGSVILDLGANIGAHTVALATLLDGTGQVITFEPERLNFQLLCANVALNNLFNVQCHHAAVAETEGTIRVPVLEPTSIQNFGGLDLRNTTEGEPTPQTAIDDLDLQRCDFIKVDIEGMEIQALKGAAKTIGRLHPILYVENDRVENSDDLISLIGSYDYRLYQHRPPLFNPDNFYKSTENGFGNIASDNMLCIPRHSKITVKGLPEIAVP